MTGILQPGTIYHQPSALLSALGSFWADTYTGRRELLSHATAKAEVELQTDNDFFELLQALSRHSTPIYHCDRWYKLTLLESELATAETDSAKYDDGFVYDSKLQYDKPVPKKWYRFPIAADVKQFGVVMNRFTDPSLLWTYGVDVILEEGAIAFAKNPFSDSRVASRPVFRDGEVVDAEAVLWIFNCEQDWNTLYQQYGYVLGLRLQSSAGYRQLMNALFDALIGGMTELRMRLAVSAMSGIPIVREAEEVVEDIVVGPDELLILTDLGAYRYHREAVPTVAIGDTVQRGDTLTSSLVFYRFNRGTLSDDLRALALGDGKLTACFYADLIFPNKVLPLTVDSDHPSGYTWLEFALGGFPADVQKFFEDLHTRGIAAAEEDVDECDPGDVYYVFEDDCETATRIPKRRGTLAHLLDRRTDRVGEPTAVSLPTTINPLSFLVENVFRGQGCAIRIQTGRLGSNATGLFNTKLLQRLVPPQTALFLILEMTASAESITTTMVNDAVVTLIPGMEIQTTALSPTVISDSRVRLRALSGRCA